MQVEAHVSLEELKRIERQEKDAGRSKRLRIVILAIEGWTAPALAMSVGLSRRICQRWVYRYNELGLAGLDDQRGTPRPSLPIPAERVRQLHERMAAGPLPEDQVATLRGKDLQRAIRI